MDMEAQSTETKRGFQTRHIGSLWITFGLWFAATAVNFLLAWYLAPLVIAELSIPPSLAYWSIMIFGAIWQMVLVLFAMYRQEGAVHGNRFLGVTRLNRPVYFRIILISGSSGPGPELPE